MQQTQNKNPQCLITPLTAYCLNGSSDQDLLAPEYKKKKTQPNNNTDPTNTTPTTDKSRSFTTAPIALTAPMCDTPSNGCCVF